MTVDYTTRYSARRKTLALTVMQDATVFVDAPQGTPADKIEAFVSRKAHWLYNKLLAGDTSPAPPFRFPWKAGRPIIYRGRPYRLSVTDRPDAVPLSFSSTGFTISRRSLPDAEVLINDWYKARARERIDELVLRYTDRLGVTPRQVRVVEMSSSWGSCTPKGTVSIDWRLIKAPPFVLRYVVIHELAHLLQLNHSPDFWRIVKVQMPDFERAKKWLEVEGHGIL